MNNKKEKQSRLRITISVLVLTVILFAEMYLMINFKESYIPIIILAVTALGVVYVIMNAIMTIVDIKEKQREEQFENINKSEKASYIMFKKSVDEIEEKFLELQELLNVSTEEIINAQKGISKVIINKNKENADGTIRLNNQLIEKLNELNELQDTKISNLRDEIELLLSDKIALTEQKLQEFTVQLKDTESRLNQAIMSGAKVVMPAPIESGAVETIKEESVKEEVVEEVIEEKPPMPDMSDPNKMMSPDDIAALLANMTSEEPVKEEPVEEVIEEKPPMPDMSDPNKMMSPDDIAALLANMTSEEPVKEEPVEEVIEEKPSMPDLSDPNKMMSPEDIAALLANL